MKDHEIARAVNTLRDVAVQYHAHQSLRERIAGIVVPLLRGQAREPLPEPASLVPCNRPACFCLGHGLISPAAAERNRAAAVIEQATCSTRRPRWLW